MGHNILDMLYAWSSSEISLVKVNNCLSKARQGYNRVSLLREKSSFLVANKKNELFLMLEKKNPPKKYG